VAKTSSSPTEKRTRKTYMLLKQKALKQNTAPKSVAIERSCNSFQLSYLVAGARRNNFGMTIVNKDRNI
jgi:hypothetical protein